MKQLLLICAVVMGQSILAAEKSRVMAKQVEDQKLAYLIQTPDSKKEKPKEGWPLLLFLHGYGECGDQLQKVKKHGPPKLIGRFDSLAGCFIVSPQCPKNSWWRVNVLKALVDEVVKQCGDIDPQRLYVTGLSMGGYGIWSFVSHYPDYFAAAIPICGGGDPFALPANRPPIKSGIKNEFKPDGLKKAKGLALWTFHGGRDRSVPIKETQKLVDILKGVGAQKVRFTAYPEAAHVAAWQKAYQNPETWNWLFSQRRLKK